ncbi:MAG: DNA polymerase/3'-5' exonuclease PolX [Candidatus Omnitrophota bacterium]|jgi:DNA polymerase (family 10)
MKNLEIAAIFRNIAGILRIQKANIFRIRAYERAAQNLEGLSEDIEQYIKKDSLTSIPGIGEDLGDKIVEFTRTGKIKAFEDLKKTIPEGLLDLLAIPSVGPKTAKLLHEELGITGIPDLEKAIQKNKLAGVAGIKQKTIANMLKGISLVKQDKERMHLAKALQMADEFIAVLKKLPEVKKISAAGSLRRCKETVRDIDILIVSPEPRSVMDTFVKLPPAGDITAHGDTKSSVRTKDGIQVDCRVVEERSFGAALLYFTGSRNFNIKLRQIAVKKELKLNEYGAFKNEKFIAGETEEELFKLLGMDYIEPELREDNGEIELAQKSALPKLLDLSRIKGDLHTHSTWSDGQSSIREMADAARKRGYSYIAVTDHSPSLKIARGLSAAGLKKKKNEIETINRGFKDFRVLYGTEVDIDAEGRLDYPENILKEFDVVVAAVHSGFKQSKEQLTRRIVKACGSKYVHIIAHPTGRLRGTRDACAVDMEEVMKAAAGTNTHLEINSSPDRLDLNDLHCRRAKELGIKLALNTDAHAVEQLELIRMGAMVARRGWLETKDIINTLPLEGLLKELHK